VQKDCCSIFPVFLRSSRSKFLCCPLWPGCVHDALPDAAPMPSACSQRSDVVRKHQTLTLAPFGALQDGGHGAGGAMRKPQRASWTQPSVVWRAYCMSRRGGAKHGFSC